MSKPFRTVLSALAIVAGLPLASSLVSSTAGSLGLTSLAAQVDSIGTAEAAFIRRQVVKQVTNGAAVRYRVIVVVGDDTVTNEVDRVEVSIATPAGSGSEGAPTPSTTAMVLPLKVVKANGNKRFVDSSLTFSAPALGQQYLLTSVMRSADGGQVGAPVQELVTVTNVGPDDPDAGPELQSVMIKRINETNFVLKVVVDNDLAASVASVDVIFVDYTGPAPIPTEVTLTNPVVDGDRGTFRMRTLTFEDPRAAVGQIYNVVVDLKDSNHKSLGYSEEGIYVEGLETAMRPALPSRRDTRRTVLAANCVVLSARSTALSR